MKALAIDQGTTSTRALLVDAAGSAELIGTRTHLQHYPAPGRVEHDPNELLADVRGLIEEGSARADLAAVGLDNQGESCLAWDAETGEPITPVIVWQDERTERLTADLRAQGFERLTLERSGLPLDPYFSASKLGWIVSEVEEARRLLDRGRLRLGTTDAFFRERLTGRYETDVTTASRTGLMALGSASWDGELCDLFGVPLEALPPIGPSSGDLGTVRCGERQAPLAASLVDQQAALYGHGCREAGDAKITCGTGAFVLSVTGSVAAPAGGGPLPTVLWQREGEAPVFGLDGGVYTAAGAVNWARRIGLFDDFEEIGAFDGPSAIERGIAFVPALAGLACPHWDRLARGAFVGLSLETGRGDMIRAVLEGIALRVAEVVEAMAAHGPINGPIPIDGGMAANPYFTQFLAAAIGRDLLVAKVAEVTALGTARLALEAVGAEWTGAPDGRLVSAPPLEPAVRERFAAALAVSKDYARTATGTP